MQRHEKLEGMEYVLDLYAQSGYAVEQQKLDKVYRVSTEMKQEGLTKEINTCIYSAVVALHNCNSVCIYFSAYSLSIILVGSVYTTSTYTLMRCFETVRNRVYQQLLRRIREIEQIEEKKFSSGKQTPPCTMCAKCSRQGTCAKMKILSDTLVALHKEQCFSVEVLGCRYFTPQPLNLF